MFGLSRVRPLSSLTLVTLPSNATTMYQLRRPVTSIVHRCGISIASQGNMCDQNRYSTSASSSSLLKPRIKLRDGCLQVIILKVHNAQHHTLAGVNVKDQALNMFKGARKSELMKVTKSGSRKFTPARKKKQEADILDQIEIPNDNLSQAIINVYTALKQTDEMYKMKQQVYKEVEQICEAVEPQSGLYVTGSTLTNLAMKNSDMDLNLIFSDGEISREQKVLMLRRLLRPLRKSGAFTPVIKILAARVPIISFEHKHSGIHMDLGAGDRVGIHNTRLVRAYCDLDDRVAPLIFIVKLWAMTHEIKDAHVGYPSSYVWTLLVINYLQVISPPVLPSLQLLHPDLFCKDEPVQNMRVNIPRNEIHFSSGNTSSLGELFHGFFDHYHDFSFDDNSVSVRRGSMEKRPATMKPPRAGLFVEEPISGENAARATVSYQLRVRYMLEKSAQTLRQSTDLNEFFFERKL